MIPQPLANGFCFGEGPRWFEGLLWFSDMLGEAVHTADMRGSLTTLPLPGHRPSGLGFRPDGSLLIASTEDRHVLRYDGETVVTIAELAELAPANLGDMVIDDAGRAYIGCQAFSGGVIVRLDPDDSAAVVAKDLDFPNGMVITEGGVVTDRIDMGERAAIACTLGGPERRTLFLLSSTDAYPQRLVGTRLSRLDAVTVDTPGAGLP